MNISKQGLEILVNLEGYVMISEPSRIDSDLWYVGIFYSEFDEYSRPLDVVSD